MTQESSSTQRRGKSLWAGGVRMLLALLFAGVFAAGSASAQATFSDEWADDSADDIKAVGSGVTESSYYSFGFAYYVETDLTSPTGAMTTTTSAASTTYSRSETWIWWNGWYGWWYVYSRHWTWNWYQNYRYVSSYTSYGLENFRLGDVFLEYYSEHRLPVNANPRRCSYVLCPMYENQQCANSRRGILRDDGGSGTEDCKLGWYRAFTIVKWGFISYCSQVSSFAQGYDPCPWEHPPRQ